MSIVANLAQTQLEAYNSSDLDAFCACYHPDVLVMDDLKESIRGIEAFRARYTQLFEKWEFGAAVPSRLVSDCHCVDQETWWRIDPESAQRSEGEILVRYTEKDGKIAIVQFLK
jgi:hypothetical protein